MPVLKKICWIMLRMIFLGPIATLYIMKEVKEGEYTKEDNFVVKFLAVCHVISVLSVYVGFWGDLL